MKIGFIGYGDRLGTLSQQVCDPLKESAGH